MSSRTLPIAAAVGVSLAALAGVAWVATRPAQPAAFAEDEMKPIPIRPDSELPYNPYQFRLTNPESIAIYEGRAKNDPQDHITRTTLAALYVQQARDSGDHTFYDKAEASLRDALKLLPSYDSARVGLAVVTNTRHKFDEGLKLAKAVYTESPEGGEANEALSVMADAYVELGNYAEAETTLRDLEKKIGEPTAPPAIQARYARLAELRGEPEKAIALLKQAAKTEAEALAPAPSLGWYASRVGEVLLSQGKLDEAAAELDEAIRLNPVSPDIKIILAKVRMAQGRGADAVAIMEKVLAVDKAIDTWLPFGDALTLAGDPKRAAAQYALAEAADNNPIATRILILHYCDRGTKLDRALVLAKKDAAYRKDVFTCDSLAWALYHNGKLAEAEAASVEALRLGTKDATLLFHAGMIAHKAGKPAGKELLRKALAVNPHFSAKQAAEAKAILGEAKS